MCFSCFKCVIINHVNELELNKMQTLMIDRITSNISRSKFTGRVLTSKPKKRIISLTWFGTITQIIGAYLVASAIFFTGYVFFAIGACCWLIFAKRTNNYALMFLECVFLSTNILGLYNFY